MGRYTPSLKKRKTIHPAIKPFYRAEQQLERILGWLQRLALLEILGIIGNIGIVIAVATYVGSEKQRRDAEVLNAWQTITNAHGQAGSGGRIQALEFLNASPGANWRRKFPWFCAPHPLCLWSRENLAGINLAVDSTESAVEDNGEDTFGRSQTVSSSSGVYLAQVQLPRAYLNLANLQDALLMEANLQNAILRGANLQNALLWKANLQDADLKQTNLRGADLPKANLQGAYLVEANLQGALLRDADLQGAYLAKANLRGVESLEIEQVAQAKLCLTKLPPDIDLPENRDCVELGVDPETGSDIDSQNDN